MDIREILNHCDHTLLAQTATWEEIKAILDDGIKYHVASCCIPPSFVKRAKEYVGDKLSICTVIGFPNGYNTADVKLFETEQALKEGADEIDMVVNIGDVKEHNFEKVTDEIRLLKNACGKKVLKVIIETCLLTDEEKSQCAKPLPTLTQIISKRRRDFRRRAQLLKTWNFSKTRRKRRENQGGGRYRVA